MAQSKSDITIPVNSLTELMEQLSSYEKDTTGRACVTVLDVYCSTWGACNVLKSTFKDISIQEVDDQAVCLKFCQVNASQVLTDVKSRTSTEPPLSPRSAKRPAELQRDILPDAWRERFQEQQGKAKPLFLFYKDCQYINSIEGVNTPYIKRTIKQLIKEKKPASEFITNPDLLELWSDQFGALESEVPWQKFCKAINVWCLFPPTAPSLNDEESKVLMSGLNVEKGSMPMVTAKGLQDWVGDVKFEAKFHEVLPGYETRISEERARREKEEKEAVEAPKKEVEKEKEEEKEEPIKEEEPPPPEPKGPPTLQDFSEKAIALGEIEAVNVGTAESLSLMESFSISVWLSLAEGANYEERDNDDFGIFGCGETGKENGYLYLSVRSQNVIFSFNGAEQISSSDSQITESTWAHVAITYSADTKEGTLYLNGSESQKTTFTEDIALSPESAATIGNISYKEECVNSGFLGKIAGFKISNTILTAEDVTAMAEDKSMCKDPEPEKVAEPASPPAEPKPEGDLNATGESYTDEPQSPDAPKQEGEGGGEEGEAAPAGEEVAEKPAEAPEGEKPSEEDGAKPAEDGEPTPPAEEEKKDEAPPETEEKVEAEEAPTEGSAANPPEEEKPAEEAPAEEAQPEAPAEETSEDKKPEETPPSEEKPAEEEEKKAEETPAAEAAETPAAEPEKPPAEEPKEETKQEEEVKEETPAETPPTEEPPAEAPAAEETPKEEEKPAEEPPAATE